MYHLPYSCLILLSWVFNLSNAPPEFCSDEPPWCCGRLPLVLWIWLTCGGQRIRWLRKRKEKERANFFETDPFHFAPTNPRGEDQWKAGDFQWRAGGTHSCSIQRPCEEWVSGPTRLCAKVHRPISTFRHIPIQTQRGQAGSQTGNISISTGAKHDPIQAE